MIQDTLAGPEWAGRLGDAHRRGLTPLFTANISLQVQRVEGMHVHDTM